MGDPSVRRAPRPPSPELGVPVAIGAAVLRECPLTSLKPVAKSDTAKGRNSRLVRPALVGYHALYGFGL